VDRGESLLIALLTVGDPRRLSGGYYYPLRMAEAAPRHAARINFVSLPARPWPWAAATGPAALHRARQVRADVVLLDSIAAAAMAPALNASDGEPPLMAILHQPPGGIDSGPALSALRAAADRRAYLHARHLFIASEALREQLLAAGMASHRMSVVPPGCDPGPAPSGQDRLELRQGRSMALLCIGNWLPRKGIHDLLEAVAMLPPDAATLHLVGDTRPGTRYSRRLQRRLTQADLRDRCCVHGQVPREEVARLYHSADVFVLPSVLEPYGTVYGEALAAGLPVIGWRAGNLPHLVTHDVEGLILPVGDRHALAGALLELSRAPALRRRLAEAARLRGSQLPRWEDTAHLLFSGIRDALTAR
jgi:glycosyltransferase involved in cell wall biosynthesis